MTELKEGDIYRWSYREPGDDATWGRYHCCSRIGVVRNGMLHDTYWQIGNNFGNGRSFAIPNGLSNIDLTFVANFADLERADEHNEDYYADADIVNLNHANSSRGNFYLRKGAKRCAAKMIEVAKHGIEKAERDERWAAERAKDLRAKIIKIAEGDTTMYL
jgi:hypothetical protein